VKLLIALGKFTYRSWIYW